MQSSNPQKAADIERSLQDLLAQQGAGQSSATANNQPAGSSSSATYGSHDPNIDPAIGGGSGASSAAAASGGYNSMSAGEPDGDDRGAKGKRELSTSKRAAQNRAAQRAFRQRKEGYIKKLEEQVREVAHLEASYKAVQAENYALRDYIIALQSRLLESQGEVPQPPPNVNLAQPSSQDQDLVNQQLQQQAAQAARAQAAAARRSSSNASPAPPVGRLAAATTVGTPSSAINSTSSSSTASFSSARSSSHSSASSSPPVTKNENRHDLTTSDRKWSSVQLPPLSSDATSLSPPSPFPKRGLHDLLARVDVNSSGGLRASSPHQLPPLRKPGAQVVH